jgi:hypothetical protein
MRRFWATVVTVSAVFVLVGLPLVAPATVSDRDRGRPAGDETGEGHLEQGGIVGT